jgi:hypothetical protein
MTGTNSGVRLDVDMPTLTRLTVIGLYGEGFRTLAIRQTAAMSLTAQAYSWPRTPTMLELLHTQMKIGTLARPFPPSCNLMLLIFWGWKALAMEPYYIHFAPTMGHYWNRK